MPLTVVQAGRRVRLIAVKAGHELENRLSSMGLVSGVEIEVLRNSAKGPLLIKIKGSRVMLGRGMAQKIVVS